jgi:hypothetical protein
MLNVKVTGYPADILDAIALETLLIELGLVMLLVCISTDLLATLNMKLFIRIVLFDGVDINNEYTTLLAYIGVTTEPDALTPELKTAVPLLETTSRETPAVLPPVATFATKDPSSVVVVVDVVEVVVVVKIFTVGPSALLIVLLLSLTNPVIV